MNRREWKKNRLTGRQIRRRKTIGIIMAAAAILAVVATVIVLFTKGPLKGLIGIRTESEETAAVAENGLKTGKLKDSSDPEGGTEDANAEDTSDTEAEGTFDREEWLRTHLRVKGIYITGPTAGSSGFEEILDRAEAAGINTIVLDIKNDEGIVTFKMPEGTPADIGACVGYIRDIDEVLEKLHKRDIYVIGRIACFKDPILAEAVPECALRNDSGGPVTDKEGLAWVNPCNETVWEYLIGIAEYCAGIGFDEIQYDYVRFPVGDDAANADYDMELTDADKHTYIEGFLRSASERIHATGIPLSADLFGTVIGNEIDVAMVGQDYAALSQCVDAICPMVYPSHYGRGVFGIEVPDAKPYDTVYAAMCGSGEELSSVPENERAIVRPWLQAFTATWVSGHITYGSIEIGDQIRAVEDAGYEEWILWNARNDYRFE